MVPWVIVTDGDGNSPKGFKSEWATVRDQHLYVGSMGKEWTSSTGEYVNDDPMFVKRISVTGNIEHVNWAKHYKAIRTAAGIEFPGYLIHGKSTQELARIFYVNLPLRIWRLVRRPQKVVLSPTALLKGAL